MGRRRLFLSSGWAISASLLLAIPAHAQNYLPESRYSPNLPPPHLLYQNRMGMSDFLPAPQPSVSENWPPQSAPPVAAPVYPMPRMNYEPPASSMAGELQITMPPDAMLPAPPSPEAPMVIMPQAMQPGPSAEEFDPHIWQHQPNALQDPPLDAESPASHAPNMTTATPAPPKEPAVFNVPEPPPVYTAPTPSAADRSVSPPAKHIVSGMPDPAKKVDPLDKKTRELLDRIHQHLNESDAPQHGTAKVSRFDPNKKGLLDNEEESEEDIARHESLGVKIAIRRPTINVNAELQQAYEVALSGQPQIAIQIYKDILREQPDNSDALFGLAATYHRIGELRLARPFYSALLKQYPDHRDGMVNFLSLVAQQSPEEAIGQLKQLERRNPNFAPIQAQLALVYDKMDKKEDAFEHMIRAVRIAPDNIAYKYNLAVMYDKHDMTDDATTLYNQLLAAHRSGIPIPAEPRDLQERIIFINKKEKS